MLGKVDLSVNE